MRLTTNDFEFAPGYLASHWKQLAIDPGLPTDDVWKTAIAMFAARIERRFLDPIDVLIEASRSRQRETFGFAILALDFLVIETLQGFREGLADHNGFSRKLIRGFITTWNAFRLCLPAGADADKLADSIYFGYRCALHHAGATNGNMLVGISGPVFDFQQANQVTINRTLFHDAVKAECTAYMDDLQRPEASQLRRNFKIVMDAICG